MYFITLTQFRALSRVVSRSSLPTDITCPLETVSHDQLSSKSFSDCVKPAFDTSPLRSRYQDKTRQQLGHSFVCDNPRPVETHGATACVSAPT
jgi:hypothetical protein